MPVLLAGVYTTAAPLLFGICGALPGRLARSRAAVLAVGLAGLAGSALPFGRLVGALYPAIGWLGLILAAGVLLRRLPPKASPARGGGCAARRRRKGALPPCPAGILQNPAVPCPASVGDDACIVPEAFRNHQPTGEAARQKPPLQGEVPATRAEGCIAALPRRYPSNPGRALPRVRRGRCLHRPANPATPQTPCGGRKRPPYKAPASG